MTFLIPLMIGLLLLIIALAPAVFLVVAAMIIFRKLPQTGTRMIAIGAAFLAFASLSSAFNYFAAYLLQPNSLAQMYMISSFVFEFANLVALVCLGIGLIQLARTIAPRNQIEAGTGNG